MKQTNKFLGFLTEYHSNSGCIFFKSGVSSHWGHIELVIARNFFMFLNFLPSLCVHQRDGKRYCYLTLCGKYCRLHPTHIPLSDWCVLFQCSLLQMAIDNIRCAPFPYPSSVPKWLKKIYEHYIISRFLFFTWK